MLEASHPERCELEHHWFEAGSATEWSALAEERTLSERRGIFVLAANGATEGVGVMWCLVRPPGEPANLGWTWTDPDVHGTPLEQSLVDAVSEWAEGLGAVSLSSAADDGVEAELLVRTGFTDVGLADDGVRPAFVRACQTVGVT